MVSQTLKTCEWSGAKVIQKTIGLFPNNSVTRTTEDWDRLFTLGYKMIVEFILAMGTVFGDVFGFWCYISIFGPIDLYNDYI